MKERIYYFDFLNVIACIAVVTLHENGCVNHFVPEGYWYQALMVTVVSSWAVPVFFMLSGATLMQYRERYDTREFFIHRFRRTVIPFLMWSLIWVGILYVAGKDTDLAPLHIINGIIHYKYQPIYWFFIPLFGLYLLMPALSLLRCHKKTLVYLAWLLFIVSGVIDPVMSWLDVEPVGYMNNAMSGPVLYVLLGYLIKETRFREWQICVLVALTIVCWGIKYFVTCTMSQATGQIYYGMYYEYYFTNIIPAVTVFVIARCYFPRKLSDRLKKALTALSSCSLGVYLLHMVILYAMPRVLHISIDSLLFRIGLIPVNYLICVGIVYVVKRVPFIGKYIFP